MIKFNEFGNLEDDLIITIDEFKKEFGYNAGRRSKIITLIKIIKIIRSFNCQSVYIGGSFITTKEHPNDMDVCFDFRGIDTKSFMAQHYELSSNKSLKKIHEVEGLHIFYFISENTEILDWFRGDRYGNKRGLLKLTVKDFNDHDKE